MKKHILLGAALLSLFAASCSNDDIINNDNEVVNGKTITLNATINNGADTRLTYEDTGSSMKVAWSSEESFTMYKGTNGTGSTFTNSTDNTGKFKGDDIEGKGTYYAVYGEGITNTGGTLSIDLSGAQVGTKEEKGIKEFMLASTETLSSSTALTFNHKLTVLKMTLTLPEEVEGTVSMVTVSGLHNKASYSLSKGTYTYADEGKGDITATNDGKAFTIGSDHTITAYVAVFPEDVAANQVKIIANQVKRELIKKPTGFIINEVINDYAYTITSARTLIAGKVVPVSASLAWVEKNLKSEYTAADYKQWSEEFCSSAATPDQMQMYLGAGVYWDDGTYGSNQQTYKIFDGNTYHAGLWLMKKAYIDGFSAGSAKKVEKVSSTVNSELWHEGRPAPSEIYKYFFLPAAGYGYNYGSTTGLKFYNEGEEGKYWSNSGNFEKNNAYYLFFKETSATLSDGSAIHYNPPMIAE